VTSNGFDDAAAPRRSSSRASTASVIAVIAIATYLVVAWFPGAHAANAHTGDTDVLVTGAHHALHCIEHGTFTGCGHPSGSTHSLVGPYPLLQYLPASAFLAMGMSEPHAVEALARLNTLAFAAALAICVVALGRRQRALAAIAIVALLASSATFQGTAGFGEMLAATALLAMAAAVIRRRPWWIVITVALAMTTKETMLPFAVAICWVLGRDRALLPERRIRIPIIAGAAAGLLVNVAFNVFRFGSPRNRTYLDPLFRTPGVVRKLNFLAGGWLSPSAGVVWFWPVATAVIIAATVVATVHAARRESWRTWLPQLALFAVIMAFLLGLAFWLSPFGWIAYGPRLAVPIVPIVMLASLHTTGDELDRLMHRLLRPWWRWACVTVAIVVVGWAQFGAAFSHGAAVNRLVSGDGTCPSMIETPVQADAGLYFRCTQHVMWRLHPSVLRAALTAGGGWALVSRILLSSASVAMLAVARRDAGRGPDLQRAAPR
jgi:hypothetical protein